MEAKTSVPFRWIPIREQFEHGVRASVGNRSVCIVRVEAGCWRLFPERDGITVWCGAHPDYKHTKLERFYFRTLRGAKLNALRYLSTGIHFGMDLDSLPLANGAKAGAS